MGKTKKKKLGAFESPELRNPSKTLLANIRFASVDEPVKTIVITSSSPNEGKTATSSNLACAIASSGSTVLLIDADMRKRCIGALLGEHPQYGLYSVLSGEATLSMAIVRTKYDNLDFLDCEPNIPSPPDLLSTQKFKNMVASVRDAYDYVIFDTPPLGPFVDAAIVASIVDGCILCVREHSTKRKTLEESVGQLQAANARILGTVVTFAPRESNDYYYAYYSSDGKRAKGARGNGGAKKNELPMRQGGVGPSVEIYKPDTRNGSHSRKYTMIDVSDSELAGATGAGITESFKRIPEVNNPYPTKTFLKNHKKR